MFVCSWLVLLWLVCAVVVAVVVVFVSVAVLFGAYRLCLLSAVFFVLIFGCL